MGLFHFSETKNSIDHPQHGTLWRMPVCCYGLVNYDVTPVVVCSFWSFMDKIICLFVLFCSILFFMIIEVGNCDKKGMGPCLPLGD